MTAGRILVTGADGFIGSHLVERLVTQGHSVRAFVLYNSFDSWGWLDDLDAKIRDAIEVVSGDIRDAESVRRAVEGCNVIYHLAALIGIPYSYQAPASYVATNVSGTLNVVQAARDFEAAKVVCTSTSEVYGTAQSVPIDENHPVVGQSPYSASKIAADQIALSYYLSFGTPVAIARPFNTYGPRQSARAVIPTVLTQVALGHDSIRLGSLHPTRDFTYVQDTVAGIQTIAAADASIGEVINIGSNFEISIGQVVKVIAEVTGADISVETDASRLRPKTSEVDRLWADNRKAEQLLGWRPEFSGIDGFRRGISKTALWYSEPGNLVKYKLGNYSI